MFDGTAFGQEIVAATKGFVERALAPILLRLDAAEKRQAELAAALAPPADIDIDAIVATAVTKALADLPRPEPVDVAAIERGVAERFAALPVPQDGKSVTLEDIRPLVDDAVSGALAVLRVPKDGKDVDPEVVRGMIKEAIAAEPKAPTAEEVVALMPPPSLEEVAALVPPPAAGKDADPEVIATMVRDAAAGLMTPMQMAIDAAIADVRAATEAATADMKSAIAALPAVPTAEEIAALVPAPSPGKDADPEVTAGLVSIEVEKALAALPPAAAGKDADPEMIRAMVAEAFKNLPPAEPGRDATPEQIAAAVEKHMAANPPKDGASVTIEDLRPVVVEVVDKAMAERPVPKDGVGLADALIDRKGDLVLTMTDGTLKSLGTIVGNDGEPGLGFDDLEVIEEGAVFVLRLARGDKQKEWRLAKPTLADCYRGVWREGAFKKGDAVTWGGSLFIAQTDTAAKPESNDDWKLAVKRGRDGKDGEAPKPPAKVKLT